MKTRMLRLLIACAAILLVLPLPSAFSAPSRPRWIPVPFALDSSPAVNATSFIIDKDGMPWCVLAGSDPTIACYAGGMWRKVEGILDGSTSLSANQPLLDPSTYSFSGSTFIRSQNRDVYLCLRSPDQKRTGSILALRAGKAIRLTSYQTDDDRSRPPLFIDSKGSIWNWGSEFIAKFEAGKWTRQSSSMAPVRDFARWVSPAEDAAGNVFFVDGRSIHFFPGGEISTEQIIPIPLDSQYGFHTAPLGERRLLIVSRMGSGLRVFNAETREFEQCALQQKDLFRGSVGRLVPNAQGDVWFVSIAPEGRTGYCLGKIGAQNLDLTEYPLPPNISFGALPGPASESLLVTRDDTVVFFNAIRGLVILREGKFSFLGRADGLPIKRISWIEEMPDGRLWIGFAEDSAAHIFDPSGDPLHRPLPWIEHALAPAPVLRDFEGRIWCFLEDQPESISRWDGKGWKHMPLEGPSVASISRLLIDDIGRVYLLMSDNQASAYRLETDGTVSASPGVYDLLADSIGSGARVFRSDAPGSLLAPRVSSDGQQIWFVAYGGADRFMHFDGQNWHEFQWKSIHNLFRWEDGIVYLQSRAGEYAVLEEGILREVALGDPEGHRFLMGEEGIIPYSKKLLANTDSAGKFYPIYQDRSLDQSYRFAFTSTEDFSAFCESVRSASIDAPRQWSGQATPPGAMPVYLGSSSLFPCIDGFYESHDISQAANHRAYPAMGFKASLTSLPWGNSRVMEDRAGNSCFIAQNMLYVVPRRTLDTKILKVDYAMDPIGIECLAVADGNPVDFARFTWRPAGGRWYLYPPEGDLIRIPLSEIQSQSAPTHNGPIAIEVSAIDEFGQVDTTPAKVEIHISGVAQPSLEEKD